MRSFVKIAVMGLVAVASTMLITISPVERAHAAEPPASSDIANDPPGEAAPPPPSRGEPAEPLSLPKPPHGEISESAFPICMERSLPSCEYPWVDRNGNITDEGKLWHIGPGNHARWALFSCNWNNDDLSIGLQVDPSDGGWSIYTKGDATRGESDGSCEADFYEPRKIRKIRFVAVDRNGRAVGTPTAWMEPPGGAGPP